MLRVLVTSQTHESIFPMSPFVIAPPPQAVVPTTDGGLFPVRRIFCVGRNYAAHTREMGGDPSREAPFFFTKPADAVVTGDASCPYPPATASLHHEIELVIAIGKGGTDIPVEQALAHVYGYAVGIDLTRRDLQDEAKQARRPWDMAKGFDASAPISAIRPAAGIASANSGSIRLMVNSDLRQNGDLSDMIWNNAEIINYLSGLVTLAAGDLIFTGTPDGVAAINRGDRLVGDIAGIGHLTTIVC